MAVELQVDERAAIVVDDSAFTRSLVLSVVRDLGYIAEPAATSAEAIELIDALDPDLVVVDLDLGDGPSGFDVVRYLQDRYPWTAILVLSVFRSPRLVDSDLPPLDDVPYLVKSDLESASEIASGVLRAVERVASRPTDRLAPLSITAGQADILRLIARGRSAEQIAEELGMHRRAVDHATRRLYRALGIDPDDPSNPRVLATLLYQEGNIDVRRHQSFGN